MADPSLNTPVTVAATRIDATLLPAGFTTPYKLYVIQSGTDLGSVAGKANEAGSGAYDAQVKNEEQDVVLSNHETRISANSLAISQLTVRVVSAEAAIVVIQNNVATLTTRVTTVEGIITTIQGDYLSKSATTNQIIQAAGGSLIVGTIATPTADKIQSEDSVNALVSYKVAGLKVIGPRETGWTASTGTSLKSAFNANLAFTVGATYSQAEITALANGLIAARQRIKALEDTIRTHGQIN
ncbi:phage tail protein [Yersinia ruckeri]|uniref:phage tail protein n=1 Tax=Yersinia ruckeri TaxID=29486 RepID=UPI0008FE3CA4|nr:phage tail protein [Yersinia ruckeri]OJB95795.1 phage tail protein [Yersinia ruckeri]OJB98596.1 phage tail protein [Yersinia ruckeri]OJC00244.1 phage tail protein [Yersinia ruckeri]